MMNIKKIYYIIIIFLLILSCKNPKDYDRYFNQIVVRDLNGNRFFLNQVEASVLIINFYSPTCLPCVEELPALHMIYQEAKKLQYEMFLAVEPNLERNLPEVPSSFKNKDFDNEAFLYLKNVLEQEKQRRNIQIPFVIVEPPFKIDSDQFVTGTPETLIFSTKPLMLRYNFVGPITTSQNHQEILLSSRYKFFVSILKTIYENTTTQIQYQK